MFRLPCVLIVATKCLFESFKYSFSTREKWTDGVETNPVDIILRNQLAYLYLRENAIAIDE